MFIQVRLLNGFSQLLWYEVPHEQGKMAIGSFVEVPLKKKFVPACVMHIALSRPHVTWPIKQIQSILKMPSDDYYAEYIQRLADYYQLTPFYFAQRMRSFFMHNQQEALPCIEYVHESNVAINLTQEQAVAAQAFQDAIESRLYAPILLHGLTGSGKTEVYKRGIVTALKRGDTVIFLLPEVSLAVNFVARLKNELPEYRIFGFHSATSAAEKREVWQHLMAGAAVVLIGVHLPILLPIRNLGCIIVDEEHEIGYQEKKHPRINSKEAALLRARIAGIPIVLGSATPSISSLYAVETKKWQFFQLTERYAGSLPEIRLVYLERYKKRIHFWISNELHLALKDRLEKKEQSILFLNRRGVSFFVQCKQCGDCQRCTQCSVTLTLHDHEKLLCHYCNYEKTVPRICAVCTNSDSPFIKKGIGTQQLVTIIRSLFPTARVERADVDATKNKKRWQATLHLFEKGEIDILVGTQTITKGYHFPNVTLVGIIWADLNLHFPIFNATEVTLQQLLQVAGRAGRASAKSLVVVQAMADHPVFAYLDERRYLKFYSDEKRIREQVGYPPCIRFVEIELRHHDAAIVDAEAQQYAALLRKYAAADVQVLGPAVPVVYMVNQISSRKIYCRAKNIKLIEKTYQEVMNTAFQSTVFFTPNPLS